MDTLNRHDSRFLGRRQRAEEEIVQTPHSDSTEKLKTGMTADVDIIIDKKADVLYVPIESIVEHGEWKGVLVLKDGKFVPRRIKTGLQDETRVEVVEGLIEGEKVKLKSIMPKKEKNGSSGRSRMMGGAHGMGMGRR